MVCVDASLYLRVLMPDETDPQVRLMWQQWRDASVAVWAPPLFRWECANGLRQAVRTGRLDPDAARKLLLDMLGAPVGLASVDELLVSAWHTFVVPYDMPAVYDAAYLALARSLECELWTADRRLYRLVGKALPWVKAVGIEA